MNKYLLKIFVSFIMFFSFVNSNTPVALATSSASFGVYPPKITITTPPAQNVQVPIKIVNGSEMQTLEFQASSIKANEDGSVELATNQDESFAWVYINNKPLGKFELKMNPSEETTLTLNIKIPKNTLENDHYLALIVGTIANETYPSTFSRSAAQIAIPIILSIKETSQEENLKVEKFTLPGISFTNQVPLLLKLKNSGSYFVSTKGGTITAAGLFGQKSQTVLPKTEILAGNQRIIFDKKFILSLHTIGPTKITVQIPLLESKNLTVTKTVIVIPPYLWVAALIAVAGGASILIQNLGKKTIPAK